MNICLFLQLKMNRTLRLLSFLLVIGIGYAQINLASNGSASQSSTWEGHNATLAVIGGPTHDFNSGSCSATGSNAKTAWWMLTFSSETVFTSNVLIYYRSDTLARFVGFSLYITNNTIENTSSPPTDDLCYQHKGTDPPNEFQNITCDQMGKHVIIYNNRTTPSAFVELCDVQITGCYKHLWEGGCRKQCPTYCTDNHCHPRNGTCVWGCNSNNCIDGSCNNDGTCVKGCTKGKGKGGLLCDENNVASDPVLVTPDIPEQNKSLVNDGDKRETSCVKLSGTESWIQVDTGNVYAIKKKIYVVLKNESLVSAYSIFVTNSSGSIQVEEALDLTDDSSVKYTHPFPVHEHRLNSLVVGRYIILKSSSMSLDICELEIIGCPFGRYGDRCKKNCSKNCDGTCDPDNGTCVFGCQSGYIGGVCNETCQETKFGRQCLETCHCVNQTCNYVNGTCPFGGCREGWKGHSCSEECGLGTFGKNCKQKCDGCLKTECNSTTGECKDTSGCKPGWQNGYPMCDIECDDWYFGNCLSKCNCRNKPCDKSTGECPGNQCDRGWMGDTCSEECYTGWFGYNCVDECDTCVNRTCSTVNGNCTYGCTDGYNGYQCRNKVGQQVSAVSPSPAGAIGGGIGGTLVVVGIAIGVVFVKRRKSSESKKSDKYKKAALKSQKERKSGRGNASFSGDGDQDANAAAVANRAYKSNTEEKDKNTGKKESLYANHDDIYCNLESSKYSVGDLQRIIQEKEEQNTFQTEFEGLPKGLHQPHIEGSKEINKNKNRFLTTWPYDHSRVILQGNETSDYINASYIENYEKKKAYIATQGPKKNTVTDFWQMVWQEKVELIVMVTQLEENGKKKCFPYWPESITEPLHAGHFRVRIVDEKENVLYAYRTIGVYNEVEKKERKVHHYNFLQWEDHGVPDTIKLVNFYRKIKHTKTTLGGPIIVHCSAGIGRTGTFLAIDALYEHGLKTGYIDVLEYVQMMRKDRMNMIQTQDQYATVYEALLEAFTVPDSAVDKNEFCSCYDKDTSAKIPKNQQRMSVEFKKLQDLKPCYTQDDYRSATSDNNISKNVNKQILPNDRYRPYLMSYGKSRNDYINAVIVSSLIRKKNIIVTQYPLKPTVVDFWTLIYDTDCSTVVCLESETVKFLPDEDRPLRFEKIQVSRDQNKLQMINVKIEHKEREQPKHVKVRLVDDWASTLLIPKSEDYMLDIVASVSNKNDSDPIAVVCRDGCTRSGIFTALYLTFQKMELENVVDLFHVVRMIQIRRPEFISNQDEYEYCYKCIRQYLEKESMYANV